MLSRAAQVFASVAKAEATEGPPFSFAQVPRTSVEPLSEGATAFWSGVLGAAVQTHEQFVLMPTRSKNGLA